MKRKISNEKELEKKIKEICDSLCEEVKEKKIRGKTITVKLKTTEFETKTRAHSLDFYTDDVQVITKYALQILRKEMPIKIRLLGVRLSGLEQKQPQSKLQRQLNDFWTVKKDKNDDNHNRHNSVDIMDIDNKEEVKEVNSNKDGNSKKRKRKRKYQDIMVGDENNDNLDNKRRRISDEQQRNTLTQMFEDKKMNENQKRETLTLSQMFKKQEGKKDKKEMLKCPICFTFECVSNLQLNIHLDQCLKPAPKQKPKQRKKNGKRTLTQFFKRNA